MVSKLLCAVVDDDQNFLEHVKRFFIASRLDYEVVAFANGVDAIEFIRRRPVDLVLTAYLVPEIDGLHLIDLVRASDARVPIVMLSNVPIEAVALARGATAFLVKGELWTHLESLIRSLREPAPAMAAVAEAA